MRGRQEVGRNPKWGEKTSPGSRKITGVKFVVVRDREDRYSNSRRIPANEVPFDLRAGSLRIILCQEGLELHTSARGNTFPNGVGFSYTRGCEVLVEVFPRGHEANYPRWQKEQGELTSFIPGLSAPVTISRAAAPRPSGTIRAGQGGSYTELLDVPKLDAYLKTHLPLLGVSEKEVRVVNDHINQLIRAGKAETERLSRLLTQRRGQ